MKFWIVTPSYNQLGWIKMCIASVADQGGDGVEVHHHVQDALSEDGTPEWLDHYAQDVKKSNSENNRAQPAYTFSYSSEKDDGMYDAINRGWKLAAKDVDVVAHLNCDEQYLPGALQMVAEYFSQNSDKDVVLYDMIVVNDAGEYICHRRSLQPYAWSSRYCIGGFTATTFQRALVTRQKKCYFDTKWRNFGDKVWYNELHSAGCCFDVCNEIVSLFTDTGENLNWTDEGLKEKKLYEDLFLGGRRIGTSLVARLNGLRRAIKELRIKPPTSYAMFQKNHDKRIMMLIDKPTGLWHKKWKK
jgi:glycosyltransferase involved in cell wall biosynthesis